MVEYCRDRDRAIAQLNHALGTLTAAVDTATVRHHLDYVKTRLTQYIHTAEAVLDFKDGQQLVAKQNEIKSMEKIIEELQEENQQLRLNLWSLNDRISGCEPSVIDYLRG